MSKKGGLKFTIAIIITNLREQHLDQGWGRMALIAGAEAGKGEKADKEPKKRTPNSGLDRGLENRTESMKSR